MFKKIFFVILIGFLVLSVPITGYVASKCYIYSLKQGRSFFGYGPNKLTKQIITTYPFSIFAVNTLISHYHDKGIILEGDMNMHLQYKAELLDSFTKMGKTAAPAADFLLADFENSCPWKEHCIKTIAAVGAATNVPKVIDLLNEKQLSIYSGDMAKYLNQMDPSGNISLNKISRLLKEPYEYETINILVRLIGSLKKSTPEIDSKLKSLLSLKDWKSVEIVRDTISALKPKNTSWHYDSSTELESAFTGRTAPDMFRLQEQYSAQIELLNKWTRISLDGDQIDTKELDASLELFNLEEITSANVHCKNRGSSIKSTMEADNGYGCNLLYSETSDKLLTVSKCTAGGKEKLLIVGKLAEHPQPGCEFRMLIDVVTFLKD